MTVENLVEEREATERVQRLLRRLFEAYENEFHEKLDPATLLSVIEYQISVKKAQVIEDLVGEKMRHFSTEDYFRARKMLMGHKPTVVEGGKVREFRGRPRKDTSQ